MASVSVPGLQYSNDWGIIFFCFAQKRTSATQAKQVCENQVNPDLATHRGSDVRGVNEIDHYLRTKSAFSIGNWFEGAQ